MKGHISEESVAMLAGDDLDPKQKAELERHLSECRECGALLEEYRQARESLAELHGRDITDVDYASVRRSVLEEVQARRTRSGSYLLRWAVAAAAVAIIILSTLWRSHAPVDVSPRPTRVAQEHARKEPPVRTEEHSKVAGSTRPVAPAAARQQRLARRQPSTSPAHLLQAAAAAQVAPSETPAQDDVAIKLETEDPNVIIIWLSSHKGERR